MEKFKNILEVKKYIHEKTKNQFSDGANGYYLTYYENIIDFFNHFEDSFDTSLSYNENFVAVTEQSEIYPIIPKKDFLIFDSMNFDEMTVIDTLDKYTIDRFIDEVKCYVK